MRYILQYFLWRKVFTKAKVPRARKSENTAPFPLFLSSSLPRTRIRRAEKFLICFDSNRTQICLGKKDFFWMKFESHCMYHVQSRAPSTSTVSPEWSARPLVGYLCTCAHVDICILGPLAGSFTYMPTYWHMHLVLSCRFTYIHANMLT